VAYRFFSNDRVNEKHILAGHFQATRERLAALGSSNADPILILHETTEHSYWREDPGSMGGLRNRIVGN
jgi:hypothetical protein